jgi:hypothetical protein
LLAKLRQQLGRLAAGFFERTARVENILEKLPYARLVGGRPNVVVRHT